MFTGKIYCAIKEEEGEKKMDIPYDELQKMFDNDEKRLERAYAEMRKWADRAMIAEKYIPTSRFAEYRKEAYETKGE
jgi:hypothetical protein